MKHSYKERLNIVIGFHHFLYEEGILQEYYKESKDVSISHIFKESNPELFILCPFIWINTDKGYGFWSEINRKWFSRIKEIKDKKDDKQKQTD